MEPGNEGIAAKAGTGRNRKSQEELVVSRVTPSCVHENRCGPIRDIMNWLASLACLIGRFDPCFGCDKRKNLG